MCAFIRLMHTVRISFRCTNKLGNAVQSKQLRDPFMDWPELDIVEVEVTDSSEGSVDSDDSDECASDG